MQSKILNMHNIRIWCFVVMKISGDSEKTRWNGQSRQYATCAHVHFEMYIEINGEKWRVQKGADTVNNCHKCTCIHSAVWKWGCWMYSHQSSLHISLHISRQISPQKGDIWPTYNVPPSLCYKRREGSLMKGFPGSVSTPFWFCRFLFSLCCLAYRLFVWVWGFIFGLGFSSVRAHML